MSSVSRALAPLLAAYLCSTLAAQPPPVHQPSPGAPLSSPDSPETVRPLPQPIQYPAVPGALPPGLYRAGAVPAPPPAFHDPATYFWSGYGPGGYGIGPTWLVPGRTSPADLRSAARIPYETAVRDAQRYHYLNQFIRRDEALLRRNADLCAAGIVHFRRGEYERAAVTFLGAAETDHGDAAARLGAGHALFALGRYPDAIRLLRRAFELQPALATMGFDLRAEYGQPNDFALHREALEQAVARASRDAAAAAMQAYVVYYTDGPGGACDALARARRLDPGNELLDKLSAVAESVRRTAPPPAVPAESPARTKPRPHASAGTGLRRI